jgi:hypothetical protein
VAKDHHQGFEDASRSYTSGRWHLPNDFDNSRHRKKSQDNQVFFGVLATLTKIRIL